MSARSWQTTSPSPRPAREATRGALAARGHSQGFAVGVGQVVAAAAVFGTTVTLAAAVAVVSSVASLTRRAQAATAADARPPSGLWDATVVANDVTVPFRFELVFGGQRKGQREQSPLEQSPRKQDQIEGAFFNGDLRVRSTGGSWSGTELTLQFDHYASLLRARWDGRTLTGTYGRSGQTPYPFRATPHLGVGGRPPQASSSPESQASAPSIAGQWEIAVKSPKGESAWRFFVRQSGAEVSASILRVDGDTGTLSGSFRGDRFILSHFSGARPLLLEVNLLPSGSLRLVQNGKTEYTAVKSSEARARNLPEPADPSRWTSVKDPTEPLKFSGLDLGGKPVNEEDSRFKGHVVLVNIMGSWCPNCHDEAPFLEALYRTYRARGLRVVSISFEDGEQLANPTRLRAFIRAYGIEYPVLLGGEPGEIGARLPQALNLNTWPATFFVGKDGRVRGTHAGFAGKATGAAHEALEAEIRATVERLLAEKA
jgi:thiol-disulfide isomerase/thioredoxin